MQPSKRNCAAVACLLLTACAGGLAPSLKQQIAAEAERLGDSRQQVQSAQAAVNRDLAGDPQLFENAAVSGEWNARLRSASEQLEEAAKADRSLEELARLNRADSSPRIERLLREEQRLRTSALAQSRAAQTEADKWVAFKAELPTRLEALQHEFGAIHDRSLTPVSDLIARTEADWPAKKAFLETRLHALDSVPADAEQKWKASESARKHAANGALTSADLTTLIQTDEGLNQDQNRLDRESENLREFSAQLYDSWDKILIDLDASTYENDRLFRERIKTIRTHLVDPASKQRTTSSSEKWVTVSEPAFRQVEGDLGMAIAHKDAGLFDFEAQTTPEPAGFAYIATEQQGSNQYGYWAHDSGTSVWHWLPEYLILRELLWNHDYRPVVLGEYRGYQVARDAGRTFYGKTSPSAPAKYGTGGTLTAEHYAGSKYVQSGGFKGSAYASNSAVRGPSFEGAHSSSQPGTLARGDGAGKRFGFGAAGSSGRRFGRGKGFPSIGRSFGRRR